MQSDKHLLTPVQVRTIPDHRSTPCALAIALAFASAIVPAGIAAAQAPSNHKALDRVVVTATRMPEDINTTMRDISVLDGTSLRVAGIVDIADALAAASWR
jgi:deoxyhypusine synthase